MRATGMAIFSLVMFSACNCLARMQNQPDPQSSGDELTVQEKKAIAKQKDILDEIMRLYAENSLDRPADFTACVREMLAMSRSKKCRDKFTHYETPEVAKQRNDDYAGQFGGIGLELMEEDGAVIITTPMVGTPSARAGFKAKDIILKVGGQEPEDINEAIAWIRGKPGTKVTLTVFRPATKQKLDFTLTREIINVQTVKWRVSSTDPKIGIVEIHKFDETVPLKFAEAIIALVKKNAPNIVIDVRDNPGGRVDSVLALLGLFAQNKDILLSMHSRHEQEVITLHNNLPLSAQKNFLQAIVTLLKALSINSLSRINTVLLINNGSASASEILAGTMKDWGYPIIGEKSYGKGVGQEMFTLSDGSVLALTTFEFLVGNHQVVIRDKGVTPTVEVKMLESHNQKAAEGEPRSKERDKKEEMNDREKEQADPQLLKAIEVLESCLETGTTSIYRCNRN